MKDTAHKFPYRWLLSDGYPAKGIEPHGCKVFGTFICGGGSTMGYKLAGFEHLGGVEIDPPVADIYATNHHPKHLFVEDIRLFRKRDDLPPELFELDILDGSPPCSTFSMAGSREKAWGKEKVFREGQKKQTLDDLFFEFIELAKKLQPKVVLAENVKGLVTGNAKAYVRQIIDKFEQAGYSVQLFLLNASSMGVPQKRERVFFIGQRKDLRFPKLDLKFNEKPIYLKYLKDIAGLPISDFDLGIFEFLKHGERDFIKANFRRGKTYRSRFNTRIEYNNEVCSTVTSTSGSRLYHYETRSNLSDTCLKQIGSFPLDYNFKKMDVKYLIGMSVPPVMTAQIAHQIWLQWLSKIE